MCRLLNRELRSVANAAVIAAVFALFGFWNAVFSVKKVLKVGMMLALWESIDLSFSMGTLKNVCSLVFPLPGGVYDRRYRTTMAT